MSWPDLLRPLVAHMECSKLTNKMSKQAGIPDLQQEACPRKSQRRRAEIGRLGLTASNAHGLRPASARLEEESPKEDDSIDSQKCRASSASRGSQVSMASAACIDSSYIR